MIEILTFIFGGFWDLSEYTSDKLYTQEYRTNHCSTDVSERQ